MQDVVLNDTVSVKPSYCFKLNCGYVGSSWDAPAFVVHAGVYVCSSLGFHKLLTGKRNGVMLKAAEVRPVHVSPPTECSLHRQVEGQPGEACAESD